MMGYNAIVTSVVMDILYSDELREALARPRPVPREVREQLAEVVVRDLVLGDNAARDMAPAAHRLGPLLDLYLAARHTEEWGRLRQLASCSPAIVPACARSALEALLDAFEEAASMDADELDAFTWLIRDALALWGREPGRCDVPARNIVTLDNVRLASEMAQRTCITRMQPFLDELTESADAIEFLGLLYPGRLWDRGLTSQYREDIGNIRRFSLIAERSRELQKMLDLIGRHSADDAPGGQGVTTCSHSELYAVVNSNDLQYLLPSELVKLRDPTLKYLFLARWTEGKLLTYQLTGKGRPGRGPQPGRGPVVALVDTSGSMSGSPGTLAKAIVLAAARRVLGAGRDMQVVLFSAAGQTETIDLSGRRKMAAEFLGFLRNAFGGGTDFDTALRAGLDALKDARYGGSDLLFVTDGLSRVGDERLLDEWQRFKADRGAQIYSVIVGNDSAGGLEGLSDRTFVLDAGPGLAGTMRLAAI